MIQIIEFFKGIGEWGREHGGGSMVMGAWGREHGNMKNPMIEMVLLFTLESKHGQGE